MIQSFTIQNFKSYQNASLKVAPLTVLVGANASGKSNALEAIRFLSWLAQGQKLSSLQYKVNQNEQIVRGRIKELIRIDAETFTLGCLLDDDNAKLSIKFDLRGEDDIHIAEEVCENDNYFLYRTLKPTSETATDILVEYNNFARGGKKPQIVCNDQQGIFTQLQNVARFADGHTRTKNIIPRVANLFEKQLANILFLDPQPSQMRDYSFISDKQLQEDGKNISAVLFHIWNESEAKQQALLSFIKSLPEQDIKSIDFLKGPRDEVMVQLIETFGNIDHKIDAGLLSDGTLRILAIASALLSATEGSIVIVEEMDNGVHPSRAKKLLDAIYNIATERNLTILISSHNPALLDALPTQVLPHVVFCYRDTQDGSSKLVSIEDIPNFPELTSQGSLGDLLTQGLVDKYVKNIEGKEEKKAKALAWLDSMKISEAI